MSLDTLLKRLTETPETPHVSPDVSPKPAWIKAETPETCETPQNAITASEVSLANETPYTQAPEEEIKEPAMEARRQKVLAMLDADPDKQRAIFADTTSEPENVILAIAVRHFATFEMLVPKAKYDPWQLLNILDRHEIQSTH